MATRQEILGMAPREAYEQAARDGYRRAVKLAVFGFKPDAVSNWLRARPQYNNPAVLILVGEGQALRCREALKSIVNAMPPGQEITLLNASPDGISNVTLVKK